MGSSIYTKLEFRASIDFMHLPIALSFLQLKTRKNSSRFPFVDYFQAAFKRH